MKVNIPLGKAYRLLNFSPMVLVTSQLGEKPNVMPVAWIMGVDFEPLKFAICIGDHSHTFKIVKKTKQFALNIPSAKLAKKVVQCGSISGSKVDKFKKFKLTPVPASRIPVPLVDECLAHIECKVINTSLVNEYNIFIAKAVACRAEKGMLDGFARVTQPKFHTLHHLTNGYFFTPGKLVKA